MHLRFLFVPQKSYLVSPRHCFPLVKLIRAWEFCFKDRYDSELEQACQIVKLGMLWRWDKRLQIRWARKKGTV